MLPERLSPDLFAAALAERLNRVVPAGLSVRGEDRGVAVYDPTWWGTSIIADILAEEDGRGIIERVETAAWAIMNHIQDVVMESTKVEWPLGPTGAAEPKAQVDGHQLRMWFGDEAAPVLSLEPVDLTKLVSGAA